MDQQWFLIWITWLPCAGKTTLAIALQKRMQELKHQHVEHLDWDILRSELSSDLSFTKEDRRKNLLRVAYISNLLTKNDVIVIAAFVSPYESVRNEIRDKTKKFIEIFVNTPIDICEERDCKWLYKKARNGEIQNFTWISDPYESPKNPEIEINTNTESTESSVERIIQYCKDNNYINLFEPS